MHARCKWVKINMLLTILLHHGNHFDDGSNDSSFLVLQVHFHGGSEYSVPSSTITNDYILYNVMCSRHTYQQWLGPQCHFLLLRWVFLVHHCLIAHPIVSG